MEPYSIPSENPCADSSPSSALPDRSAALVTSSLPDFSFSLRQVQPNGVGAGLSNLGNTCFINAVLQCFTHTVPLVQALRSSSHFNHQCCGGDDFCVMCALRDHVELSLSSSGGIISPLKLVDNLNYFSSSFRRYEQEDAHEFLQCLLDRLERCCLDSKNNNKGLSSSTVNLVQQVFGGRLISKLHCCNCGHWSDTYEPMIDLSLEIEHVDTLPCALESFTKVEKIEDPETKFKCENCKKEVSVEKQLMVDNAPSVAAFHLKRFKTDGSYVEKIDKHVDFPLELDLQQYTGGSHNDNVKLKYNLYAIVVHIGFTSTSGHYFCFVRSSPDTWHRLDDSKVTSVQEDFVLSQEAYILFYAREGTPWFSSLIEVKKPCLDPNISNTSPKSVLDNLDTILNPSVANNDSCEDNETRYCAENDSAMSSSGTGHHDVRPEESRNAEEGGSGQEKVGHRNKEIGKATNFDIFCPLTPSRSPSPDKSFGLRDVKYHIPRDHLKLETRAACRRPLNKALEDEQRREALRYMKSSMTGSRRAKMLDAMLESQNKGKDKKRMGFSPNKRVSPPSIRRKTDHISVIHNVAV